MSLHDGIAAFNSACDGRDENGKPCPFTSFVLLKRRYLGEMVRLCDEHFAAEIGEQGLVRLADLLDYHRKQREKARKLRAEQVDGKARIIPIRDENE